MSQASGFQRITKKQGVVTQPGKEKVSRSAKNSALGSLLFCMVHFYYNVLVISIDSRLPIVLFVG